jgi:hypothetical protein
MRFQAERCPGVLWEVGAGGFVALARIPPLADLMMPSLRGRCSGHHGDFRGEHVRQGSHLRVDTRRGGPADNLLAVLIDRGDGQVDQFLASFLSNA